jgi:hypothetical protein
VSWFELADEQIFCQDEDEYSGAFFEQPRICTVQSGKTVFHGINNVSK